METLANTVATAAENKPIVLDESQLALMEKKDKDAHLSDDDVESASTSSPKSGNESDSGENEKSRSRRRERYSVTNNKTRYELINMIEKENISIKKAAEMLNINYSTAKSILGMYKKEGRIVKKTIRKRSNKNKEASSASAAPLIGKCDNTGAAVAGQQTMDPNNLQAAIANQNALNAIYAAAMMQNQPQAAENMALLQLFARLQAPQGGVPFGYNNNVLMANQLQALVQQAQLRQILAAAQAAKTEEGAVAGEQSQEDSTANTTTSEVIQV